MYLRSRSAKTAAVGLFAALLVTAGIAVSVPLLTRGDSDSSGTFSGAVYTKEQTGRPFDAVSGVFLGTDGEGRLIVDHQDGEIRIAVRSADVMRRGGDIVRVDELVQGEELSAVGDIRDGILYAESVSASTWSVSGIVIDVQQWGVAVQTFYGPDSLELRIVDESQVHDRDGTTHAWGPHDVRSGVAMYAVVYTNAKRQHIVSRIWFYD